MIHAHRIPKLVTQIFPKRTWRRAVEEPIIYLTFDDGPIPQLTPWVLGQLRAYHAKATFFCVGENVQKHPEIYQQILEEGHLVGNHTFNHLHGWKTDTVAYVENVALAEQYITNAKKLFRPPYGKIKSTQVSALREQNYEIVMWSVLSGDYHQGISPEVCWQRLKNHCQKGEIVVFHDNLKAKNNLYEVLPKFLAYFSNQGYQFQTL